MFWRKGLFNFYGIYIDIEWCLDWKWDCVVFYISLLEDWNVLDVGCGSGYYMWCMLGEGVNNVIGIDFI